MISGLIIDTFVHMDFGRYFSLRGFFQESDAICEVGKWDPMKQTSQTIIQMYQSKLQQYIHPETNIAPENKPSQKEHSIQTIHFQGLC